MRPCRLLCLVILLVVLLPLGRIGIKAQEAEFSLLGPEQIKPYQQEHLRITLPGPGSLRLEARDQEQLIPLMVFDNLAAGTHELPFWGLDLGGEPLKKSTAGLLATWQGEAGTQTAFHALSVQPPVAALQYVVLTHSSIHQQGGQDLLADHQVTRPARIDIALLSAKDLDTPLRTWSIQRNDALPHRFRFDKTLKGKPLEPGEYALRFFVPGSPQPPLLRSFTILAGQEDPLVAAPMKAADYLPDTLDDQAVWRAMMAPAAVVTLGARQHQAIYQEPSAKSAQLGMVHGQTAGLMVLQTGISGFARVRAARHGDGEIIEGFVPENRLMMVKPHERYGLLLDKQQQTLTLYEYGMKKGSLAISTGIYVPPGSDSFETLPGAFLTQDRMAQFDSFGFRYLYALRIDGGNLLHQAGFKLVDGLPDYSEQTATLGQKASHGCVRIDQRMNEQGLSPYWLYANLPRNTKVLVTEGEGWAFAPKAQQLTQVPQPDSQEDTGFLNMDDQPEEALAERAEVAPSPLPSPLLGSLLPQADGQPAKAPGVPPLDGLPDAVDGQGQEAQQSPHPQRAKTVITLTFGGDSVLGSEEHTRKNPDSFDAFIENRGESWPFSGLSDIFSQDDLTLVNLENVFKDDKADRQDRLHNFRGPTRFAALLPAGGVDLVNLANNHFVDYGQAGRNSTRKALRDAGVPYAGYGSLYVYQQDGYQVGFGGIRETVYHQGRDRIKNEVQQLLDLGCDYVVYSCHFGNEYQEGHNDLQTRMAHAAIDAGANLVIGHHPHVVQGIEEYKQGLIFYSLGNLVFGGNLNLPTFDGLLAQVSLSFDQNSLQETRVRLLPVLTSGTAPQNDFRPILAQGEDKQRILRTINQDSGRDYPEEFTLLHQPGN